MCHRSPVAVLLIYDELTEARLLGRAARRALLGSEWPYRGFLWVRGWRLDWWTAGGVREFGKYECTV